MKPWRFDNLVFLQLFSAFRFRKHQNITSHEHQFSERTAFKPFYPASQQNLLLNAL